MFNLDYFAEFFAFFIREWDVIPSCYVNKSKIFVNWKQYLL